MTISTNGCTNAAIDLVDQGRHVLSQDEKAVLTVRNMAMDMTHQNEPGHGGSAVGMAAIGVALWKYIMKYNPSNPSWFNRDRFVLSNGHSSIFLYIMSYLTGFDNFSLDELKGYGATKENGYKTICHAHPEIEVPGVEVTTGPLGQGIANAVGLAIASKNLESQFNRPDFPIVNARIFCMTGDGCMMEGVALEAIALAGHLKLDNLFLIYDNNAVTCDGPLDWINTEDVNSKMRACGWEVIDVHDGRYDVASIVKALDYGTSVMGKPVFINIRTVIGVGTQNAGTAKAHHGRFDMASVEKSKQLAGVDPTKSHQVTEDMMSFFRERKARGKELEQEWDEMISRYSKSYPTEAAELATRRDGQFGNDLQELLSSIDTTELNGTATRESNGIILDKLWRASPVFFGGGADLINSNKITYGADDVFHPSVSFKGRYIRYGIREHAMASISNGIAAFSPQTFLPVTATFLMFYLYAAPGVRMGALSNLQVIHCATHDSFAEGQNGPTHQPVELDSLFRAMPNLTYIRPCDAEEVIGAWSYALAARHNSSMLSVARDPVGPVPNTSREMVKRGCYVVMDTPDAALTLVSCGSNLHYAVRAAEILTQEDTPVRVVSAPSLDLFALQDDEYHDSVFPSDGKPIVSVEEYVPTTWAKYATASIGMSTYGYSASNKSNYRRFQLDTEGIMTKTKEYLKWLDGRNARTVGWRML